MKTSLTAHVMSENRLSAWSRHFTFQGKQFFYNRIPFNNRAERAVEVPIAFDFLARRASKEHILEVGNVLSYYENALSDLLCIRQRRIVDKFEVGHGIDNVDIIDLDAQEKYQTIVCVSTVEHVGQHCSPTGRFGEQSKRTDLEAPLKAIVKIYDLLADGGQALLTVPFGKLTDGGWYIQFSADYLDLLVSKYGIPQEALSVGFLKHIATEKKWSNPRQIWAEASSEELKNSTYNTFWSGAKAIAVLKFTKVAQPFTFNTALPATPLVYARSQLAINFFLAVGLLQKLFQ